jgi:hypothetical protein
MQKKTVGYYLLALTAFVLVLTGCQKQDLARVDTSTSGISDLSTNKGIKKNYSNEVATKWFDTELALIKSTALNPPLASRVLGYTGVTLYESIVEGMPEYASLRSKLGYTYTLPAYRPNEKYFWPAVANAALYTIVGKLFSNATQQNLSVINTLYNTLHEQHATQTVKEDLTASEAYGRAVAESIFEWSKEDGIMYSFVNFNPDNYTVPTGSGGWEPTAPAFAPKPLLPYWGENRPFLAINVGDECLPPALALNSYSTDLNSNFYKQAMEVYQTGKNQTPEQKAIALYWNDGGGSITPPGHNINIATQMIRDRNVSLEDAAIVYAKVGMAGSDAFIACWKGKYKYNLMRPITFIQKNIDPAWVSTIPTPPFPTYASGHATVSGATSVVLTALFGDNVRFTDRTHESQFGARQFNSFYEAAAEAAASRLYGGIHYRMDNDLGLEKGKMIGKNIADLRLKK